MTHILPPVHISLGFSAVKRRSRNIVPAGDISSVVDCVLFYLVGYEFTMGSAPGLYSFLKKIMATKWKIDPAHSEIQFKVKHLMVTTISGHFHTFDLELLTEGDDFTTAHGIEFTADVNSISTRNQQRDAHLRSVEFFDTDQFGMISFSGKQFEKDADEYLLQGELTIKGITKPIVLHVDFGGIAVDPYHLTRAGFTVTGKISRKAFGLNWDSVTEAGQVIISDDIQINCEVELIRS